MANRLSIFADAVQKRDAMRRQLSGFFELTFIDFQHMQGVQVPSCLLFDIDFRDGSKAAELKDWLKGKPKDSKVIFVTDKGSHIQDIQAKALGATDVVHRPVDGATFVQKLFTVSATGPNRGDLNEECAGVGAALDALNNIFSSACLGVPLDPIAINSAGELIVDHIEEQGLRSWINTVRKHHNQTYQHCLLVTGVAVAFGQHLGFSQADRHRMAFAGMVHDIGKARVPIAILEKPTPLTGGEMALLRKHPEYGLETLKGVAGISQDMLDIVIHHHEYLDGSGYPHGLCASEISDFVRVATICDVFGALLERRAYKPPIRGDIAYQMLLEMGPKLDKDLVRAFGFASALRLEDAA
jgi:putative nucleotidyltransferase with HDIG domain